MKTTQVAGAPMVVQERTGFSKFSVSLYFIILVPHYGTSVKGTIIPAFQSPVWVPGIRIDPLCFLTGPRVGSRA